MEKHYLFISDRPLPRKALSDAFGEVGSSLIFFDNLTGELVGEEELFPQLEAAIGPIHEDLGANFSMLSAHKDDGFSRKLLHEAPTHFPNQLVHESDAIFKETSYGDYSSLPFLSAMFGEVKREVMLTAVEYLRCGLNASLASRSLFIHRNTFNYRLDSFIAATGLDIRDYHNALLLEIYLQWGRTSF